MDDGISGGGVQPVRACEEPARSFFPMTKREKLLCVFLVSVIFVALYNAVGSVPYLIKALSVDDVSIADAQGDSYDLQIDETRIVRGEDGREYVSLGASEGNSQSHGETEALARYLDSGGSLAGGYSKDALALHGYEYDLNRDGVYRFNGVGYYRAGIGGSASRWVFSKFVNSAIGKKFYGTAAGALLTFALQTGAVTVLDETLAEEASVLEPAVVTCMETVVPRATVMAESLAADGVVVSEGEMGLCVVEVMAQNATRGVTMTTEELVAASADEYVALQAGQSGEFITDEFLSKLSEGLVACEDLPWLSQAGQSLLEMFGYEVSAFPDASGFTGSGGGEFSGDTVVNYGGGVQLIFSNQKAEYSDQWSTQVNANTWTLSQKYGNNFMTSDITVYINNNCNGVCKVGIYTSGSYIRDGRGQDFAVSAGRITYGSCGINNYNDFLNQYRFSGKCNVNVVFVDNWDPQTGDMVNLGENEQHEMTNPISQGISNFFQNGGQLVGNDAQFDDGGGIADYGNADITPSLYDQDYNPHTWAEVLDAAGLNAVQPGSENPSSGDEVIAGENEGGELGEVTGKPTPGKPGSTPTIPRVTMQLDGTMADLQGSVSTKFPFSIPFDVAAAVNMLVATPEAPHFTWVFALPTGNVNYEIDLSEFSPVANVLRTMLNVIMVFSVITLLGKIAQVWGFFDKSGD